MLVCVPSCVSGTGLSGSCHDQVEEDWKQGDPPCICGFAMDRSAADAALRFQPVGTFLVRMCSEPGSFAISCRTSSDPHHMTGGLPGECCSGCFCEVSHTCSLRHFVMGRYGQTVSQSVSQSDIQTDRWTDS